jgi:hypothetical protein
MVSVGNAARTAAISSVEPQRTTRGRAATTGPFRSRASTWSKSLPDQANPVGATKTALRSIARRYQRDRRPRHHPRPARGRDRTQPRRLNCVGTDVTGQLLVTASDNPDRLRSDAAFSHLCGDSLIPASSDRTNRFRFNRGGDQPVPPPLGPSPTPAPSDAPNKAVEALRHISGTIRAPKRPRGA